MKLIYLLLAAGLLGQSLTVLAQNARQPIGGGGNFGGGGLVKPSAPKKTITRTITYLALTKERQWLNASGKSIFATLVAFDSGDKAKSIPPTIIKAGKIRLLKEKKVFLLPLDNLSPKHRSEVISINSQVGGLYQKNPATVGLPGAPPIPQKPDSSTSTIPLPNTPPTKAFKNPNPPPRPLSAEEIKRHATQLGPPPESNPAGCPAMLASIKNGAVTSIAQSKIKHWGPVRAYLWKGKPYWTITVTYPDASGFGSLDTRAMALMTGTRVIKWLYSKSGEEVP
jgi:hypothetical protein